MRTPNLEVDVIPGSLPETLFAALAALDRDERAVLLAVRAGATYRDVAASRGVQPSETALLLRRALLKMRGAVVERVEDGSGAGEVGTRQSGVAAGQRISLSRE